jgi:WD40 repeat protein
MTSRAQRQRRQRRFGIAAVLVVALGVAAAMGLLWRRSESARAEAVASARHAESQQLYTLGQAQIELNPTTALAYALASLERNDTPHARQLALRALWQGPPAFFLAPNDASWANTRLKFSNDGEWLAGTNTRNGAVRLWKNDGSVARQIREASGRGSFAWGDFDADSQMFVVTISDSIRIYSLPAANEIRRITGTYRWGLVRGQSVITGAFVEPTADGRPRRLFKVHPLDGAPETVLGVLTYPPGAAGAFDIDRPGHWLFGIHGGSLFEFPLRELGRGQHRLLVRGDDDPVQAFALSPDGDWMYTWHQSRAWQTWRRATGAPIPGRRLIVGGADQVFDANFSDDGRWLAAALANERVAVWDLQGPAALEPFALLPGGRPISVDVDHSGSWMAVQDNRAVTLWPLTNRHPRVLRANAKVLRSLVIDPGGRWMMAGGETASGINVWPLRSDLRGEGATVLETGIRPSQLQLSPRGNLLAAGSLNGVWLIPQDGGNPEQLPGFTNLVTRAVFDRDGRRVAAGGGLQGELAARGEAVIRVWDLDTRAVRVLEPGDGKPISNVEFMPDGRLLAAGPGGVRQWNVDTGSSTLVLEGAAMRALPSPDGRHLLILNGEMRPGGGAGPASVYDLMEKRSWTLASHGTEITSVAWHPSGQVLTGSLDGMVRVGALTGEEPHLLMGHEAAVWNLAAEPGGRWFASTGNDGTVRIWPMPEGQPFHTLQRSELLDRLRALTNYRIVADPSTASGYRLDFEPFTGWNRKLPSW